MKILLSALFVSVLFASLFSVAGCKKTYTTVVQDSVFYSSWTPLKMTMDVSNGDTAYYQDFSNSRLTAKVISRGAVVGYMGYPNTNGDTVAQALSEFTPYVQQLFTVGAIEVLSSSDLTYSASQNAGYLYRYVIIPANVLANTSLKGFSQQQLNKMSFTDVQKAINNPAQGSSTGQGNSLH